MAEGSSEGEERGERRGPPRGFAPKPVKLGEKVRVHVDNMGKEGDGVAKVQGFVVFVKGATDSDVGQDVDVNITFIGRKFAIGEKV